jgi:hypothetical protein
MGRPKLSPEMKADLGKQVRVSHDTFRRLEASAQASGRSLSRELMAILDAGWAARDVLALSDATRERLDSAAEENCRTRSQEAEYRLRASFKAEDAANPSQRLKAV